MDTDIFKGGARVVHFAAKKSFNPFYASLKQKILHLILSLFPHKNWAKWF